MAYRQRNIPVTSKEESETQTDVRLLETYLLGTKIEEESLRSLQSNIKLQDVYQKSGLLRPFTDRFLLNQLSKAVLQLKNAPYNEEVFGKRLQIIEKQITGLLTRDFMIHGSDNCSKTWQSYYSTLNQKEKEIIKLERQKIYSDLKISRLEQKIQSLEHQVKHLSSALVFSQKALDQNKLYSSFYERVSEIINTSNNTGVDLLQIFSEQILPVYTEFNFNLNAITRVIGKEVSIGIRPIVLTFAKELDRLIKQQQLNEEKLSDTIIALITNFKAIQGVQQLKKQINLSLRTEEAETKYKNMVKLFHYQLENLRADQPYLKGVQKLDYLLRKLEDEKIDLVSINGWINLVIENIKIHQIEKEDKKLRQLLGILSSEFKRVYLKFPELKNHCSPMLIKVFESEVLAQLIQGASIQKLKEIIVHEVEVVRVNDVYTYENTTDSKLIYHLRVLLKGAAQELHRIKKQYNVDIHIKEEVLAMLDSQCLDLINVEEIIQSLRPPARFIQVPIVLENKVFETKTFQKGVVINRQNALIIPQEKLQVVAVNKQVPVYIDRPIQCILNNQVPVEVVTEKMVEVTKNRDVIVDRIVEVCKEVPTIRETVVALYQRQEIVKEIPIDKVVRDIEIRQVEKIVEVQIQKIVEVQKIVQKLVVCNQIKQVIKEVQVKVPYIIKKTQLQQVQKRIPYIIQKQHPVQVKVEIPIELKVPQIQFIEVYEYRDKPVVRTNTIQKSVPVELKIEKQIVREVPKEIFIERSHFIKGDKQEVIRQVEVFIDKPIIQEIFTTKDVEVQKIVPLYITEQIPVYSQIHVPYITEKIKEIQVQTVKIVTAKQQIIKPVNIEKPVPIVVEKEIIRVQPQYIDRIIQRIVEVPRIVEVERIVQKIVVVPRIIEKIVEVPKIVQRIVVCYQSVLQIVQIPIPQIIIQQVQIPIEVLVDRIVIVKQKDIQTVEVQKIVEKTITTEKCVEVQVQKRIPYEVIKEVPVPTYRDRIQYVKLEICETKVQAIEVQVPFKVQEPIPFIVERPVITHEVIQQPTYQKLYYEKERIVICKQDRLITRDIIIQKPILVQQCVQVPGPQTIITLTNEVEVECIREKIVKQGHYVQIIKEIVVQQDKIVPLIHEKIVSVPVNEIIIAPEIIEVPKLVNLVHYKEIAVQVPVREQRVETTIVEKIKEVQKTIEVPIEIQVSREIIKQIVNDVKCIINQQIVKQIINEIQILKPTETKIVTVPGETIVKQLRSDNTQVQIADRVYQKLVEKIIMIPQIVEIIKNVHHISQVNQLGVAVGTDASCLSQKFNGVNTELRTGLIELLKIFKSNVGRQPELKNIILLVQKYLVEIDEWIKFPKFVEIEKIVVQEVEKEKIVTIHTENKEKSAIIYYLLQKCLTELKRIKQSHKISLALDEDIIRLFFSERRGEESLEQKYGQLQEKLKEHYSSFGEWSQSHPFLIGSLLHDHLGHLALVQQANKIQKHQEQSIQYLRNQNQLINNKYHNLLCINKKLYNDYNSVIRVLEKYRGSIQGEQYDEHIKIHRSFFDQILGSKLEVMISTIQKGTSFTHSIIQGGKIEESEVHKDSYISDLISKLSKYQSENQSLLLKTKRLELQVNKSSQEINRKSTIIKNWETDFDQKILRARQEFSKSQNITQDLIEENKRLAETKRILEREVNAERLNTQKAKRQQQISVEGFKRENTRQLERKEKEFKDITEKNKKEFDRQVARITNQLDRIKKENQRHEQQLFELKKKHTQEIRTIRQSQLPGATDKHNQLINENIILRNDKSRLEVEFEKLKLAAAENNSVNQREAQKLKTEIEKLQAEKRELRSKPKEGFLDLPQETQLYNIKIQLEKKIKSMQNELQKYRSRDSSSTTELKSLKDKIKNLEVQLQISKKELEASVKLRSTAYHSGYKSGVGSQIAVESSLMRSPRGAVLKSAEEKGFVSPQSIQSQERIQQLGSSSSRFSHQEGEQTSQYYKSQMTLREFMQVKHGDDKERDVYLTYVMIKVIQAVENQAENGIFNSYSPSNIYLQNFNSKHLDKLSVKFGAPIINKNSKSEGLYLAPEVLSGSISTKKSMVFCLGVILDELIHGAPYFRTTDEIQNLQIQFKVRGQKLNPILKNTLFEMMNKEPSKRLQLVEAKRRLSLQKYITAEGRSSVTATQRLTRKREE